MKKCKVLVLEDHPFQRTVLEHNLKSLTCVEVFSFGCATAAFSWLQQHREVDIVICDLMLAGTDGLSFLRQARARFKIRGVALYSDVDKDLRRAVSQMVKLLGFQYLGDLAKSPTIENLSAMIECYRELNEPQTVSPEPELLPNWFSLNFRDFKEAVTEHQFVGFYQPKFSVTDLQIEGAEVLVRWQHPVFGLLHPNLFIEPLIRYGLLDEMFLQLFRQGIKLQKRLLEQNYRLSLAYNLDISQLNSTELVYQISKLIRDYKLPPKLVTIEITESGLILAPALNMENLIRLRMLGCELAIDDFGAAYSSLARLCELPFSQMKLDACFVAGLDTEPRCKAAISSVIALSDSLDMQLVIEGIETAAQLKLLQNLGCNLGQGFYFSHPLSEADFCKHFLQNELLRLHG
ncbi:MULTISPECIES: EAL domain-containing response regulator [Shewanella]|jgi:EAL domain-containing protein (putative c-di-GMP-specific phosphodiesterase class I)|uniref:EAL domain-containing protein n=2 Tax=Shewanella TaxID=22 RepID=A0A6G7LM18_9GAMM|nr:MULTISPECIES: EAL domain-containing response regulator [Shewanella]MCA0950411.1 EAL domain-containing response regulator [Shewanella chilikensis]MCE9850986.1 EAL domain-containing response regulator [Shewanella chilikensis]MCL1153466.1 EAL domain-containing response regulator [Shewanella chilikensis]MCL1160933.1 EAL domain-containing response regulator [Shewanella chilikensis]PYE59789.1 EAL domain-containing protein (putative c-di-GMP-specific phosphodiesterase class I) [Shewanella chiliken